MADIDSQQYRIPQNYIQSNNEAQLAEAISARLEAEHAQQAAAFAARLDERQYAIEAATVAARLAAEPEAVQAHPVVSEPTPVIRPEHETFKGPNYGIKEVENVMDSCRSAQLELNEKEKNRKWLHAIKSLVIAPRPVMAELKKQHDALIEKESITGGQLVAELFAEQGVHTTDRYRFYTENHEWFLYREGHEQQVVRYIVTDNGIVKIQSGHTVEAGPGEEPALRILAPRYMERNIFEHYPLDAAITELMAPEPNLDTITNRPDSLAA